MNLEDGKAGTISHSWYAPPCNPAGKSKAADVLQRWGLLGLSEANDRVVPGRGGRDMGLLPDAQPCTFDRGSGVRAELATGHRRGASTVHAANQFPREMAWLLMVG